MIERGAPESRRRFLKAGLVGTLFGSSGCLRFISVGGDQTQTGPETEAPTAESTATTAGGPGNAQFSFEYGSADSQVVIRYDGGPDVKARHLQVQSTAGTQVQWPELGSTQTQPAATIPEGATAVLGENILNWGRQVGRAETIRIVYTGGESPITLGRFTPPGTPTPTQTPTDTPTPTPTPTPVLFRDDFQDGTYDETWDVTKHHEEESLTEDGGVLTYESPIDATIYEPDMTVITRQSFSGTGTHVFEANYRTESYRRIRIFRVLSQNTDGKIELSEVKQDSRLKLSLPDGSVGVAEDMGTGEWRTYRMEIDFDASEVVSVTRAGQRYELNESFSGDFGEYKLGIGEGNGVSKFESVSITNEG
jgi:hypothetical protein